jgi:uncharacterized protein YegP (UPF0339 family)
MFISINLTFQIHKAKDGWRWRCLAPNKKIVAESGEAYAQRDGARKAVNTFITALRELRYLVQDGEPVRRHLVNG